MRPAPSQLSSLTIELENLRQGVLARYGERGCKILDTYHADYLFKRQLVEDDCLFGEYPTLFSLGKDFDGKFPATWLMVHLHDLSEYCGCRDKLSGHALQQCASVISKEYGYLKVTELILFFYRFKAGQYGRFYGSVDPIVITTALRDFLKERAIAYNRHEQDKARKAKEEDRKTAITWEEYCRRTGRAGKEMPLSRCLSSAAPATTKPKTQKRHSAEFTKSCALSIINNTYHISNANLVLMAKMFKKQYGCTPEEYIERNK